MYIAYKLKKQWNYRRENSAKNGIKQENKSEKNKTKQNKNKNKKKTNINILVIKTYNEHEALFYFGQKFYLKTGPCTYPVDCDYCLFKGDVNPFFKNISSSVTFKLLGPTVIEFMHYYVTQNLPSIRFWSN